MPEWVLIDYHFPDATFINYLKTTIFVVRSSYSKILKSRVLNNLRKLDFLDLIFLDICD